MFGLINRDQLTGAVGSEFEHLMAGLRNFLLVAHNEDGTIIAEPEGTDFVPTGALMDWSTLVAPAHWVLCDGRQLNRVDYKRLFDVIGVTYGIGDGSTTFNVPDTRGRHRLGLAAAGTGSTLGGVGGALDHTHTGDVHTHTGPSHSHSGATGASAPGTDNPGDHQHSISSTAPITYAPAGGGSFLNGTTLTGSAGSHSHTVNSHTHSIGADGTGATGSGGGGATSGANAPFIAFSVIIKD